MLSTWHTSEMVSTGRTKADGNPIVKPSCVILYSQGMGGVDRSDQISYLKYALAPTQG